MSKLAIATKFFHACEELEGRSGCQQYVADGARFDAQSEPIADIATVLDYCVWVNCYHAYPAHAAFGGYKKSGIGRETHKMALNHYQQTKNVLVSHGIDPLVFF